MAKVIIVKGKGIREKDKKIHFYEEGILRWILRVKS
jgi:hypothetical protein